MPNRIIKESICSSDSIDGLSWFEECFFYRLIVNCDDYGRMDARTPILRARLFPLKAMADGEIEAALAALEGARLLDLYRAGGRPYLQLRTWERHQSIRAKRSKYPAPGGPQAPESICTQTQTDARGCPRNPIQSESESDPKGEPARAPFTPPSAEEVAAYCRERSSPVDPQGFLDYYAARGWLAWKTPMRDWKAALRAAERWDRWKEGAPPSGGGADRRTREDVERMRAFLAREREG